jgi:hypothetical protein
MYSTPNLRRTALLGAALSVTVISCSGPEPTDRGRLLSSGGGVTVITGGSGGVPGLLASGGAPMVAIGASASSSIGSECKDLKCRRRFCASGVSTTISGKVYDPSGTLPLYNVMVYVPNAPLAPFTPGANCSCELSGEPIAAGLTDTEGRFVVKDAPVGANVPLVIQIGKWRRLFTLPSVAECAESAVPDGTLRLPGKRADGDMPKVALTTGGADALECLLPKLGIDSSEITNPDGPGHFNYFGGHGGTDRYANTNTRFPPASDLWKSVDTLKPYDMVLLSCEGEEYPEEKGDQAFKAMAAYTALGGRMFASHWQQVWLKSGPYPVIAQYTSQADLGNVDASVVTTFPKGKALSEWLLTVQASAAPGQLAITNAQRTIVTENPQYAQRWIATASPAGVQYLSANTPFGSPFEKQCGRVVLSDLHVAGGATTGGGTDSSSPSFAFPSGCVTSGLTPQEKVLAFMLFDISACTIPDTEVPAPPVVR